MQDGSETSQGAVAEEPPYPQLATPPRRRRSAKPVLITALATFALGAGLAGWLVWHGDLDAVLPRRAVQQAAAPRLAATAPTPTTAAGQAANAGTQPAEPGFSNVETRLALLEDRFSRIDQVSTNAAANASRAEALLVALAIRRTLDQGEPLGYLESQLRLRFGGAQPQAVQTIVAAAKNPVTLYQLSSQLEAAAPALAGERRDESTWTMVKREVSSLFVVRRSSAPRSTPFDRVDRAQILLTAGRIDDAIAEVERLPGADDAEPWIAAARRYAEVQRALEIIETAAMLEPRQLRDGEGQAITQPSPLAPTADQAGALN